MIAALLAAMGTDALAQAGVNAARAEAVVNVAERMANRLSHAFARKVHQPAATLHWQARRPTDVAAAPRPDVADSSPKWSFRQHEHLLYLPPPALA